MLFNHSRDYSMIRLGAEYNLPLSLLVSTCVYLLLPAACKIGLSAGKRKEGLAIGANSTPGLFLYSHCRALLGKKKKPVFLNCTLCPARVSNPLSCHELGVLSTSQDGAILMSPLCGNPRPEEGTKTSNPTGKETRANEWEVLKRRRRCHAANT